MAKLLLKVSKPFTEHRIKDSNGKTLFFVGVKTYSKDEIKSLSKEHDEAFDIAKLSRLNARLEKVLTDISLSESEIEQKSEALKEEIEALTASGLSAREEYYKRHVLYLKNITVPYEDDEGNKLSILVKDTRTVEPVEPFWETPEECLAVLLDTLFEEDTLKGSLQRVIFEGIFNVDLGDSNTKN